MQPLIIKLVSIIYFMMSNSTLIIGELSFQAEVRNTYLCGVDIIDKNNGLRLVGVRPLQEPTMANSQSDSWNKNSV